LVSITERWRGEEEGREMPLFVVNLQLQGVVEVEV
jgi:hypothetical protein